MAHSGLGFDVGCRLDSVRLATGVRPECMLACQLALRGLPLQNRLLLVEFLSLGNPFDRFWIHPEGSLVEEIFLSRLRRLFFFSRWLLGVDLGLCRFCPRLFTRWLPAGLGFHGLPSWRLRVWGRPTWIQCVVFESA